MTHDQMFATVAIAASLAATAPAVQASYVSPSLEMRLQAAAEAGPDRLRHLVWRTRGIYQLTMAEAMTHVGGAASGAAVPGEPSTAALDDQADAAAPATLPEDVFARGFFTHEARD